MVPPVLTAPPSANAAPRSRRAGSGAPTWYAAPRAHLRWKGLQNEPDTAGGEGGAHAEAPQLLTP